MRGLAQHQGPSPSCLLLGSALLRKSFVLKSEPPTPTRHTTTQTSTHHYHHQINPMQARRLSGEERYAPYLQLRKIKDHFIFTIESAGAWRPHELFQYAVEVRAAAAPLHLA